MCKYMDFRMWLATAVMVLMVIEGTCGAADMIYVDADGSVGGDGQSWWTAYKYLQDALKTASSGYEVRVAQGTYRPDDDDANHPDGSVDRSATFRLINGVAIKGGYAGIGADEPNERDIASFETVLSGDLAGNDVEVSAPRDLPGEPTRAENSYHVVTGSNTDANAILDGFTITGGNSDLDLRGGGIYSNSGSPTVKNCTFRANSCAYTGGAMFNSNSSNPTLSNCTFSGNWAGLRGGAMINNNSGPSLTNCRFRGNSAGLMSGGIHNFRNSSPVLINCVFSGNRADGYGGAMLNSMSVVTITNCTFVGNFATNGNALACDQTAPAGPSVVVLVNSTLWDGGDEIWNNDGSTITVTYSNVHGGWPGMGNIDADPRFVGLGYWGDANDPNIAVDPNAPNALWFDGDYHLLSDSPCIDAGDNAAVPPNAIDLDADSRIVDGDCNCTPVVDVGAYEFGYIGDLDCDELVNNVDFAIFGLAWLTEPGDNGWNPCCDIGIPTDNYINWHDLDALVDKWLAGVLID